MRQARFAGVSKGGVEPARAISTADFLIDLRPPGDEAEAVLAGARGATIAAAIPFLAAAHLVWAGVLLVTLIAQGRPAGMVPLPLIALLALDFLLWGLVRRTGGRPHLRLQIVLGHALLSGCLCLVIALLLQDDTSLPVKAAFLLLAGTGIAAWFTIPPLLAAGCLATIAGVTLIGSNPVTIGIVIAATASLGVFGLVRAGELISGIRARFDAERVAHTALRLVAEFEESKRGWFWETDPDGRITYLSDEFARQLAGDAEDVVGRPMQDLLRVGVAAAEGVAPGEGQDAGDAEHGLEAREARRLLAFHLSARFPFADVAVRAPSAEEAWWSVSGTPHFDPCGRFLGFRGIGTNLSEQSRSEAETSKLARYDSLTGLPNRPTMRAMLDAALTNAAERLQGCALLMIDLDRFKQVNDTLGHPAGDTLLKLVALRLGGVIGDDGQVGRLGGDEFEAILPGIAEESRLSEIARRMIDAVSEPYEIEGHRIEIGTSVGIAVARPGKAYSNALIRDADLALYAAKAAGRGTFRLFAPHMHAEAAERQILESELREALAKNQLRLHFQPIVESLSEEVVAFEALLRWQHPTRGLLLPSVLVPLAEEIGLMPRIGDWVVRTACAEAARWPEHVRIAVNLSPSQFADAALGTVVANALAASGLAPERLELEITEAVFPADGVGPERILKALKGLGVRLALDNFGTGRSGLGHLRESPLDKIKIDQSFVRGAAAPHSRNAAIIRSIVVLAESLGMDTTAEGAETLEEVTLIRSLGCSQVQGFIFGKPVPCDQALALASASNPSGGEAGFARPPRHRLIRMGALQIGEERLPVRLRNISEGGAMIECDRTLSPDTPVQLDLEDAGRLEADVRWCQRGQIGLRFVARFELARLARSKPTRPKAVMPRYLEPPNKRQG
ncbi:EAL domain-containing protein [Allosphingosinicella deserti]|uniref:EAL domain-containing protein n=1 Tax=Allosphingosinicella deserti TaxID=2116704 RepID=UPI001304F6E7|nr:EAL domain-containing protein [Sphingomonas deserti]